MAIIINICYLDIKKTSNTFACIFSNHHIILDGWSSKILLNYVHDIYLNLCIFSSLVYLVVITTGADVNFIRFTLFFTMGYILIWPIILKNHPSSNQLIFKISFYSIHILFLYIYLQKMSDLIPYEVNPMFELL